MAATDWQTATATLRLAGQLVDGIQEGLAARGFTDIRPAHGYLFAALSTDMTTAGIAVALGITKQATAQLVDTLVERGYLSRQPDPRDGRAHLVVLTDRGYACTQAAEQAASDVVNGWHDQVSKADFARFSHTVHTIAKPGPLRPSW
ncbi:MAG TPA: MarR family transcriptional regulator [Acidothermaceae bacterium]